jgi:misacylated tRNA(Ala) deacylase
MTEAIFHADATVREFEAIVTAVDDEAGTAVLDRTAFYAGGGGQPCDHGALTWAGGRAEVRRVGWSADGIVHTLEGGCPVVGTQVRGTLDWTRRYALMRTHTAMHILCGVVWRDYGAQVTGGNMEPLAGRLDFEFESMSGELVGEIESRINAEVAAAREVRVAVLPREEAFQIPDLIRTKINLVPATLTHIRTVEIVGLDLQADGGTHVANTREVGHLRVAGYKSKGRINKRIQLALDAAGIDPATALRSD